MELDFHATLLAVCRLPPDDCIPGWVDLASQPLVSITRTTGPPEAVDQVNRALPPAIEQDGRVFIAGTTVRGRPALRACSVNHRLDKSHVELALQVVRELGSSVA